MSPYYVSARPQSLPQRTSLPTDADAHITRILYFTLLPHVKSMKLLQNLNNFINIKITAPHCEAVIIFHLIQLIRP